MESYAVRFVECLLRGMHATEGSVKWRSFQWTVHLFVRDDERARAEASLTKGLVPYYRQLGWWRIRSIIRNVVDRMDEVCGSPLFKPGWASRDPLDRETAAGAFSNSLKSYVRRECANEYGLLVAGLVAQGRGDLAWVPIKPVN